MKFGIFYEHSVQKPWSRQSQLREYQQALEQIELADELGFDLVSGGRLEFGTGRSATWTEVGGFNIDPDSTKEMWDEVIRAIPKMWTEDEFEWNGKYFK